MQGRSHLPASRASAGSARAPASAPTSAGRAIAGSAGERASARTSADGERAGIAPQLRRERARTSPYGSTWLRCPSTPPSPSHGTPDRAPAPPARRARARTAPRRYRRWLPGGAAGGSCQAQTQHLLLARADVHLTNLYGRTALHYAAMEGIVSACRALVDAGALPDELDHHGFIAVQHAVLMKRANWDHVDFLIEVIVKKPSEEEMLARRKRAKTT